MQNKIPYLESFPVPISCVIALPNLPCWKKNNCTLDFVVGLFSSSLWGAFFKRANLKIIHHPNAPSVAGERGMNYCNDSVQIEQSKTSDNGN